MTLYRRFANANSNLFFVAISIFLLYLFANNLYGQDLVAYYPFNNNAKDESGNNNNGEVFGATLTCNRFGIPSSAYAFNGNNFIKVNHSNSLMFDDNDDLFITAWIKFSQNQSDFAGIVVKGPTNINRPGFQFFIINSNRIAAEATIPDNDFVRITGSNVMDICKWYFVAVEFSTSKKRIRLFVDGVMISEIAAPVMNPSYKSLDPLFIGKDRNSVRFFKGSIDDIRIYRGALSDSAVQALYHENGWPNAVPSLKIIPNGPTEFCEGQSVTLTAPQCIRSYQWSNGATTSSITVNTSGNYRLTGYDADGCIVAQDSVDVTVLNCSPDTATGDFTINIRSNCPGHTERMTIPFVNTYYSDTLTSVSFTGSSASAFSYNGTFPKYLPPTTPVLLPITFRWVKPGSQKVVMTLSTSSGRQHRILLKTPVGNAITPFLNLSEVRVGPQSAVFDTCLTVTNLLDAGVTLKDTVWLGRGHSFKITAPALPFYIGSKGSAQLCFRIEPLAATAMDTVFIAAENAPNNCLACFYQPIEVSTRPPRPMISSAEDEPVTGNGRLKMAVFPNPNMGEMTLLLQASHTLTGTILVVDEHGRTVIEMANQKIYSGNNLIPIGSPTLSSGRYSIVLQSGAMRLVEAITVQQ
ncbi:MAG: LamG domain-containing protein [Armatimonadetes bacterium]|nr:LamG domain-containing protein [Armatimonadota bacterium]